MSFLVVLIPFIKDLWTFVTSRVGILIICCAFAFFMGGRIVHEHAAADALQASLDASQHQVEVANDRIAALVKITADANARERAATTAAAREDKGVQANDVRLSKEPAASHCILTRADVSYPYGHVRLRRGAE